MYIVPLTHKLPYTTKFDFQNYLKYRFELVLYSIGLLQDLSN